MEAGNVLALTNADIEMIVFISLPVVIFCSVLGGVCGRMRGWPWMGAVLGLVFGPLGVLIACVLPLKRSG